MFSRPVTELIQARYSCRSYRPVPVPEEARSALDLFLREQTHGPFGTPLRLVFLAATQSSSTGLRGLGTYGIIRHPAGFVIGLVHNGPVALEDVGHALELSVLKATDLDLGTCWLGGTFQRSNFAARAAVRQDETLAAVIAVGVIADDVSWVDRALRLGAGSTSRLAWQRLYFDGRYGVPLSREAAGGYAQVLDMARLAPSASNKQPWRVVRSGWDWHLYLRRTPGYRERSALLGLPDLQRVDMGIFTCHWELTARQLGLRGRWETVSADQVPEAAGAEYRLSWVG